MNTITVKEEIKAQLELAGAENVFIREPRLDDIEDVRRKLTESGDEFVQYWTVLRSAAISQTSDTNYGFIPIGCVVRWINRYIITCNVAYLEGMDDREDSMDHFDNLVDTVLTAFAPLRTMNQTNWNSVAPMSLIEVRDMPIANQIQAHQGLFLIELIEDQEVVPS